MEGIHKCLTVLQYSLSQDEECRCHLGGWARTVKVAALTFDERLRRTEG